MTMLCKQKYVVTSLPPTDINHWSQNTYTVPWTPTQIPDLLYSLYNNSPIGHGAQIGIFGFLIKQPGCQGETFTNHRPVHDVLVWRSICKRNFSSEYRTVLKFVFFCFWLRSEWLIVNKLEKLEMCNFIAQIYAWVWIHLVIFSTVCFQCQVVWPELINSS